MSMKALSPNQMAWLLPIALLTHQLEEYFGNFPLWYSNLLNVEMSNQDFILINGFGLFFITIYCLSYLFNKNNLILVAMGTLVFVNGITHLVISIFTLNYSPGTISGVLLFLPLGIIIYQRISPQLRSVDNIIGMAIGIVILFTASMIAMNIW